VPWQEPDLVTRLDVVVAGELDLVPEVVIHPEVVIGLARQDVDVEKDMWRWRWRWRGWRWWGGWRR
jgi:hypothetical protein